MKKAFYGFHFLGAKYCPQKLDQKNLLHTISKNKKRIALLSKNKSLSN